MIYKIETKTGMLPYEFATLQEAKDYVSGILSWSGTKYRIHKIRKIEKFVDEIDELMLELSLEKEEGN
jgi:hypothetical protein